MKFEYGTINNRIDITNLIHNNINDKNIIIPIGNKNRRQLYNLNNHKNEINGEEYIFISGCPIDENTPIKIDITKKICLCFYGLTRSLKYTHSSINNNILKILIQNNYYFDIYLHTYNLDILTNNIYKEINCRLDFQEYKLLNPDYFHIQNQKTYDE